MAENYLNSAYQSWQLGKRKSNNFKSPSYPSHNGKDQQAHQWHALSSCGRCCLLAVSGLQVGPATDNPGGKWSASQTCISHVTRQCHSFIYAQGTASCSHRWSHAHCCSIHSSQEMQAFYMSFSRRVTKRQGMYTTECYSDVKKDISR